jgi:hypothetical protein
MLKLITAKGIKVAVYLYFYKFFWRKQSDKKKLDKNQLCRVLHYTVGKQKIQVLTEI